jgi:hypothetical protein
MWRKNYFYSTNWLSDSVIKNYNTKSSLVSFENKMFSPSLLARNKINYSPRGEHNRIENRVFTPGAGPISRTFFPEFSLEKMYKKSTPGDMPVGHILLPGCKIKNRPQKRERFHTQGSECPGTPVLRQLQGFVVVLRVLGGVPQQAVEVRRWPLLLNLRSILKITITFFNLAFNCHYSMQVETNILKKFDVYFTVQILSQRSALQ